MPEDAGADAGKDRFGAKKIGQLHVPGPIGSLINQLQR
jgi:hypothetical protein